MTKAALMLAEANTIQKAKELKDLALTAKDWATRKGLGNEAIQYARFYALEAERRMGELLAATERAKGTDKGGRPTIDGHRTLPSNPPPTLSDMGISKNESAEAQMLAALPDKDFEDVREGKKTKSKVKKEKNIRVRRERQIKESKESLTERPIIIEGHCLTALKAMPPIDLLLTDPPYFTEGDFTGQVSACLARVKPTGQAYIFASSDPAEVAAYLGMDTHGMKLEQILVWNYNNTGQRQPNERYISNYQLVFYYRGPKAPTINKPSDGTHQYACQTVNAPDARLGDRFHEWQKPLELIERFIRNSSKPGDFVFDPFAGSGTTILAAAKLGRKVIGCDNDSAAVKICIERGCIHEP
jgi:16S rRNA G966 N2-methylase RsmD